MRNQKYKYFIGVILLGNILTFGLLKIQLIIYEYSR